MRIEGLSEHQIQLLNRMWRIDSMEDLHVWIGTLPKSDQLLCNSLIEMVRWAQIDEDVERGHDVSQASTVINSFMRKQK